MFRRRHFFQGRQIKGVEVKDLTWLRPDGKEMGDEERRLSFARSLGVLLCGDALAELDARGRPLKDDNFLLLLNAHYETISFTLPGFCGGTSGRWLTLLDTHHSSGLKTNGHLKPGDTYALHARSLSLLMQVGQESQGGGRAPSP